MNGILKELLKKEAGQVEASISFEQYLDALKICLTFECKNQIERWEKIPGLKKYEASNLGKIRSLHYRTPTLLTPIDKGRNRYANIVIGNNRRKQYRWDYLIAITYWKKPDNSKRIIHKDGDHKNCIAINLAWK